MTPFLIAAIACGLMVFAFGTLLRPWSENKRQNSGAGPENTYPTNNLEDIYTARSNYLSRTRLLILLPAVAILTLVPLFEYIYIKLVHYDMNRHYFFDGPIFKQIVFGCVFGTFLSFWLLRGMVAVEAKKHERSLGKEENVSREGGEGTTQHKANHDSQQFALYSELPTVITLLIVFLFGVFDEATIVRIARLGGNVKLPGGVEFAFGRNESRSSETSVAQLVPPANSQNSYAPPSVSQGLQSLAELGQTMRRDALIYALSKRLVVPTDGDTKLAIAENSENSIINEKSTEANFLSRLHTQITLVDEVFAVLANCLIKENEQHLDYMSSGDQILQIAQRINVSLRGKQSISDEEIGRIFPSCRYQEQNDKTIDANDNEYKIVKYAVNIGSAAKLLRNPQEFMTPYTWIAAANIFEYNHRYVAAIALLEHWLRTNRSSFSTVNRDMSNIFEIRVRSLIGGYLYEWMNYQPVAKTQAVIDYYRITLNQTSEILNRVLNDIFDVDINNTLSANWDCNSYFSSVTWNTNVEIPDRDKLSPRRMKLAVIYSLLSMKQSWINTVVDGADYEEHRNKAREYATELRDANVSCMGILVEEPKGEVKKKEDEHKAENYVNVLRAQNLYAYSSVMRADATLLEDAAIRKSHLNEALSAAEEGLERVKDIAERDRHMRRFPEDEYEVSFTTSGTPALEVFERLEKIIRRTRADLERL